MARTPAQIAAQKKAAAASAAKRRKPGTSTKAGSKARAYRDAGNAFSQHGMGSSGKARRVAARALSGKGPKRYDVKRSSNQERAVGVRWGAEGHSRVGKNKTISPAAGTHPHKAIGSQSSPVASKPGKPMKAPGVAKPTGQDAFTSKRPKAKLAPNHYTPLKQAATHRTATKIAKNQPVFGTKKRYPSSKRKGKK